MTDTDKKSEDQKLAGKKKASNIYISIAVLVVVALCTPFILSHDLRVSVCSATKYWVCIGIKDDAWELVPSGVGPSWYRILKIDMKSDKDQVQIQEKDQDAPRVHNQF